MPRIKIKVTDLDVAIKITITKKPKNLLKT